MGNRGREPPSLESPGGWRDGAQALAGQAYWVFRGRPHPSMLFVTRWLVSDRTGRSGDTVPRIATFPAQGRREFGRRDDGSPGKAEREGRANPSRRRSRRVSTTRQYSRRVLALIWPKKMVGTREMVRTKGRPRVACSRYSVSMKRLPSHPMLTEYREHATPDRETYLPNLDRQGLISTVDRDSSPLVSWP
jgi:hypothetical protein